MKVVAFARKEQGSGASRRLRNAGQTPGIIYGGTGAAVKITLDPDGTLLIAGSKSSDPKADPLSATVGPIPARCLSRLQ